VNGNHGFVATDGKQYAIAIRGSLIEFSWDAFDNWIYQDMNVAIQKNWPYCSDKDAKISQGAYRGWENLTKMKDSVTGKTLLTFLQESTTAATAVIFTGHSLGGNLATVFASYFSFKQKEAGKITNNINVITFAAPAAGNTDFANSFNKQFPQSVRIEGKGDIVPKFPCTNKVAALGSLYSSSLAASKIMVGYKNVTVPLSTVFKTISTAMSLLELKNGLSEFAQTNGEGKMIDIPLSGKNNSHDITQWFAEAGYQHSVEQYAKAMGAPVIDFTNN
jgi:triacylglycerol lipase